MLPAITKRIVVINGFTQSRYRRVGLFALWRTLKARHSAADCDVTLHPWNDDWAGFVDQIVATGPADYMRQPPRILVCAYSWGVGSGFLRLARALNGEGLPVHQLVSCDGVCRPAVMRWRALWSPLMGDPKIVLPPNVQRVDFIRQQLNRPRGHEFVPTNGTVLRDHGFVRRRHEDIDNSTEFFQLALRAAANL